MDLSLSEEQLLFSGSVARWLERNYDFEQRHRSLEAPGAVRPEVWTALSDLGLFALPFPEEMGGLGLGQLELGLAMEPLGRHLLVEPVVATIVLAGGILARGGSSAQQERWLAPLMMGAQRVSLAHDEAGFAIASSARRDGKGWRIAGRKSLSLGAPSAETLIVSANDEAGLLRLFVVPIDAAGVTLQPLRLLDGGQAADIQLRDVRVTDADLLDCDAAAVLDAATQDAIVAASWEAVGAMNAALKQTADYVKQREQFGRPLATFQALQHKVAEMAVCCEEARAAALLVALAPMKGLARVRAVSAAKVKISACADVVAKNAVQLHGGMGVSDELPIASYFRKLLAFEALFGSSAEHLAHYAEKVIGERRHADSAVLPDTSAVGLVA